ncbi:MAG: hypothetical protein LUQ25_03185 [Methanoregulaceae archaeon]|nr:hypothetical protein [Methanoregulaceae archaeon]
MVFACGCTTTSPVQESKTPPPPPVPNLLGNWTGPAVGYIGDVGYTDYSGVNITMQVEGQKDRIFWGKFSITNQTAVQWMVGFSGVIGRDGMTVTIAERNGGYSLGTINGADMIELIHFDDNDPSDVAIDTLKKV